MYKKRLDFKSVFRKAQTVYQKFNNKNQDKEQDKY